MFCNICIFVKAIYFNMNINLKAKLTFLNYYTDLFISMISILNFECKKTEFLFKDYLHCKCFKFYL